MPDIAEADAVLPPFSDDDKAIIDKVLEEAQLKPADVFKIPTKPDPVEPDTTIDPTIPRTRVKELYNGQSGRRFLVDREPGWQPRCAERFTIRIEELWTPPPQGLAGKFDLWARYATMRAVLICLKNEKCRRPVMIGCNHALDEKKTDGTCLGRANFVFECGEI